MSGTSIAVSTVKPDGVPTITLYCSVGGLRMPDRVECEVITRCIEALLWERCGLVDSRSWEVSLSIPQLTLPDTSRRKSEVRRVRDTIFRVILKLEKCWRDLGSSRR